VKPERKRWSRDARPYYQDFEWFGLVGHDVLTESKTLEDYRGGLCSMLLLKNEETIDWK
jgi:hypothetical protein